MAKARIKSFSVSKAAAAEFLRRTRIRFSGKAVTESEITAFSKGIARAAAGGLTGLRQEPLSPRGKPKGGSGVRIPLRSQQSVASGIRGDTAKKRREARRKRNKKDR